MTTRVYKPWRRINYYSNAHECTDCQRNFVDYDSLLKHLQMASFHHYCSACELEFPSANSLSSHEAAAHDVCTHCHMVYYNSDEYWQHVQNEHERCDCGMILKNSLGLHEHSRQAHPSRYCVECGRLFNSPSNYNAHRNSSIHRKAEVPCPFATRGCNRTFIDLSHVILHLESGTCVSRMTRDIIDRYIAQADRNNVITNPQRMLTNGDIRTRPTLIAADAWYNWDISAWECILCHNRFGSVNALNAHLVSPRHSSTETKLYRCPKSDCRKEFSTASGLCQHIESGSCGVLRFTAVKNTMDNLINGSRRLTF